MFRKKKPDIVEEGPAPESSPKKKASPRSVFRVVGIIVLALFVIITLLNSIYVLQEDEYAVIRTFGATQVVEQPGIKLKIPYLQEMRKVSKAAKQFSVGYDLSTGESIDSESFMITKDYNFVNVDFYFEYLITDPVKYFYASEFPEDIIKNLAQSYIRDTVGIHSVDDVLTTGKYEIQTTVKTLLQERLEQEDIGITVTNAVIQDAEVPTAEVTQAFKNVEDAKQGMETAINNANADANTRLPKARADADKIMKDAQARKSALVAEAEGQTARFNSLYNEYINYPLITKQRMFYETMEAVLPFMKIYITDGSTQTLLPLDKFSETLNPNGASAGNNSGNANDTSAGNNSGNANSTSAGSNNGNANGTDAENTEGATTGSTGGSGNSSSSANSSGNSAESQNNSSASSDSMAAAPQS